SRIARSFQPRGGPSCAPVSCPPYADTRTKTITQSIVPGLSTDMVVLLPVVRLSIALPQKQCGKPLVRLHEFLRTARMEAPRASREPGPLRSHRPSRCAIRLVLLLHSPWATSREE